MTFSSLCKKAEAFVLGNNAERSRMNGGAVTLDPACSCMPESFRNELMHGFSSELKPLNALIVDLKNEYESMLEKRIYDSQVEMLAAFKGDISNLRALIKGEQGNLNFNFTTKFKKPNSKPPLRPADETEFKQEINYICSLQCRLDRGSAITFPKCGFFSLKIDLFIPLVLKKYKRDIFGIFESIRKEVISFYGQQELCCVIPEMLLKKTYEFIVSYKFNNANPLSHNVACLCKEACDQLNIPGMGLLRQSGRGFTHFLFARKKKNGGTLQNFISIALLVKLENRLGLNNHELLKKCIEFVENKFENSEGGN